MRLQPMAAVSLLLTVGTSARSVIDSGQGFGTYYYDIEQVDSCGTTFQYQNKGGLMCSPTTLLSLDEISTNHVVAMNNTQLGMDLFMYCGKRVVVSINGRQSDLQLFIGDGCQRCGLGSSVSDIWKAEGAPGLDFSYTVLNELSGGNACDTGHYAISWEILDEKIYDFDDSSSAFVPLYDPLPSNTAAVEPFVQSTQAILFSTVFPQKRIAVHQIDLGPSSYMHCWLNCEGSSNLHCI
ncbi:unnamed protein product [Penicillium salamii]|uniref:Uncharacterized protein n=1 Tax=Penicillium salamii TaxID=1612424 RepID=A0A9W4IPS5_9EURO|nr:unnamed protein product [Penicillium salamii]